MKNRLALVVFVMMAQVLCAQRFELGQVSVEELEEKAHPKDTAAVAAVLYNKFNTKLVFNDYDQFSAEHEFQIRIKIYKKEGLDLANYELPYYVGYSNLNPDSVTFSDCATYNLVNGNIEKTKLTDESVFKENKSQNWNSVRIVLPKVKVGSVIEFKYTLKSEDIITFPEFNFQREIPVNYSEYKTEIPEIYLYKTLLKGNLKINTARTIKSASGTGGRYTRVTYVQNVTVHTISDIPAIIKEPFIDNIDNYKSSITHELELVRYTNKPSKDITKTWNGVAQNIYSDSNFGTQLKNRGYFESDLKTVLNGVIGREAKILAILSFVKAKVKWNNHYGIFTKKGVINAYKNRIGNAAEVNFILIAMLNAAGILSSPVLVSTVGNGVASYPNQTAFNFILATTELDGKQILLDATNKYSYIDVVPTEMLNWTGRILFVDGSIEEISMVPPKNSRNSVNIAAQIAMDGKLSGKARISKTDYEAFEFREKYADVATETYLENLENMYNGLVISNYSVENKTVLANPVQETFDFFSDNHVEIIGGKMYINPLLFFTTYKNPFVQEERKLPVYFGFPKQKKYNITLEIPDGYAVESLPQGINIATGENVASFKFNLQQTERKIQISATFEVNTMLVSQDFYPVLKDFFQKITDKQNEKIILKKI